MGTVVMPTKWLWAAYLGSDCMASTGGPNTDQMRRLRITNCIQVPPRLMPKQIDVMATPVPRHHPTP